MSVNSPAKPNKISVVLGSYNRLAFLKLTLGSVRKELSDFPHEIIIVDGGSNDGTLEWLMKQKDVILIVQHNRGTFKGKEIKRRSWGYFMNLAFKCAEGKYICMISDDCLIVPNAIRNGYHLFEEELEKNNKTGAMAFYWRNWPEQSRYWVGKTLGDKLFVNHGLYLKSALKHVGYIDENLTRFYFADGDLCLKLWHEGYQVIDAPNSYIEHYSHANNAVRSTNRQKLDRDWNAYLSKWENIYYFKDKNNIGSWIEKKYDDVTATGSLFKTTFDYKKSCCNKIINKVRNGILAIIRG